MASAQHARDHRAKKKSWLAEQKNHPCSRCGGRFPACVMDFHHRDPSTKLFSVGQNLHFSEARLVAEIAKCDLYCANCHRIIEHEEK